MAFSLVGDARAQWHEGNTALEDGNKFVRNIEDRLWKFDAPHTAPSRAFVEKLPKEIGAAQVECA